MTQDELERLKADYKATIDELETELNRVLGRLAGLSSVTVSRSPGYRCRLWTARYERDQSCVPR